MAPLHPKLSMLADTVRDLFYAEELVRQVRKAIEAEPVRFAGVRSWSDLDERCDANEFIGDVDAVLGLEMPDDGDALDAYFTRASAATVAVDEWLQEANP